MSFLLGALVIITWLMQEQQGVKYNHSHIENYLSLFLLAMFWGTSFLLFAHSQIKKKNS
ncbi:MAG: hypothetical protein ABJC98_09960 [Bacteroidota bacterium]